ncbi:MAG: hypothetical protein M3N52_02710 [Actinomycetota bacterium]|nr:hypothetical protein [Actinomycetota bacterium]
MRTDAPRLPRGREPRRSGSREPVWRSFLPALARIRGSGALALLVVVVPFGVVLARLAAEPGPPVRLAADFALTELATREAAGGGRLLGPWSRFDWNHPGPSYFYLLVPFYRAWGEARGLYAGALIINLAAALGVVAVVARRSGQRAALWAAVVVLAFGWAVGPARLRDVWNPFVVALPTLLFVVLCAAYVAGSRLSLGAAAVIGSFVVQTHVGTAPFVAALLGTALIAGRQSGVGRRVGAVPARAARAGGRVPALALAAVTVLMWVPALIEQVTAPSGNLTELGRFALSRQPGQPLGEALAAWTAATSVVPLGLAGTHELPATPSVPRLVALGAWALVAATCVRLGRLRRDAFVTALGESSLLGGAVCAVLAYRVPGALLGYLLYWMAVVPLAAWIGLGVLAAQWLRRPARMPPRLMRVAPVAAAVGLSVALSLSAQRVAPISELSDERVDVVVGLIGQRVDLDERPRVLVTTASHGHGVWIPMAGVVNELDRRGVDVSVGRWLARYGTRFRRSGTEDLEVLLGRAGAVDPALAAGAEWIGRAGITEVLIRPGHRARPRPALEPAFPTPGPRR